MTLDPPNILRNARIDRGYESAADAARHFGWSIPTYTSHENGTRGIRIEAARKYAKAFGIPISHLVGLSSSLSVAHNNLVTSNTPVLGEAAWGVWREGSMPSTETETLPIPQTTEKTRPKWALRIGDASLDRSAQIGDYAIIEAIEPEQIPALGVGRFVAIRTTKGDLFETTIRRIASIDANILRMTTDSKSTTKNAVTKARLPLGTDLVVTGVVVGWYRPAN